MNQKNRVVGINILLTGGIGSGKSTVAKIFELLGVPIFYDDLIGRNITNTDLDVIIQIKLLFGNDIYINGQLDRKKVASRVFSNKDLLKSLSSIIHPAVQKSYSEWLVLHSKNVYTIRESALAQNENNQFHFVISVSSPIELRLKRVALRDNCSELDVAERISHQMSQEERNQSANFIVLCNDEELVIPQIIDIHNTLVKK